MKNDQKFKEKIASIAAMIAEGAYEGKEKEEKEDEMEEAKESPNQETPIDAEKLIAKFEALSSSLEPYYKLINNAQELSAFVVWIVEKFPISGGQDISGLRKAIDVIAKKKANANTPDAVDTSDLPALQEAFNRINRK